MGILMTEQAVAGKNAFGDIFRNYDTSKRQQIVQQNYHTLNSQMTMDVVTEKKAKWLKFDHGKHTVMSVIEMLDDLVDDSDPDNELPNSFHDYQTAERIRSCYPDEKYDWFHLVGFLHDLGKIMSIWGEPQWCVVGDTFAVGCKHVQESVFPEFFFENPDSTHPVYSTDNGIYKPGCGIDNLNISWGHDEYMYQVLKHNKCSIPEEGLAMIRYHSFYPWHTGGAYKQFENPVVDDSLKEWVLKFNQFDLYSKSDAVPVIEDIKPYYEGLLVKYGLDGLLEW